MALFKAEYFVRWLATSHDTRNDTMRTVYIESKSWEAARAEIVEVEERDNQYCGVEFVSLQKTQGALWKR